MSVQHVVTRTLGGGGGVEYYSAGRCDVKLTFSGLFVISLVSLTILLITDAAIVVLKLVVI